jgi:four helix bundle protein
MQDFKHIRAWQRAHALGIALDVLVRRWPRTGHGSLRTQLTRAADSIAANIVEGCGSATNKEFARFLDIAIKSANETENHLLSARDRGLIAPSDWERLAGETVEIRKMIYGYRNKILGNERDSR